MLKARYAAAVAAVILAAGTAASAFAADTTDVYQMRLALRSLHTTERHLTTAKQDFDGHRAKALDLVKQAEAEVQAALPPRPPRTSKTAPPATPPAAAAPSTGSPSTAPATTTPAPKP